MEHKSKLWKNYFKNRTQGNFEEYRIIRNKVVSAIRKEKNDYLCGLLEYKNNSNKLKLYEFIKNKNGGRTSGNSFDKILPNKSRYQTACDYGNYISEMYNKISTPLNDINLNNGFMDCIDFNEERIIRVIEKLNETNSMGWDNISNSMLKKLPITFAKLLSPLYMASYNSGFIPEDMLIGIISPIEKIPNAIQVEHFRPITTTTPILKVMEYILKEDFVLHKSEDKNTFIEEQHGFTQNKSCISNLIETNAVIEKAYAQGKEVVIVYLDLAKAFDTVPHNALINAVNQTGAGDKFTNWIAYYLKNRSNIVKCGDHYSGKYKVHSGIATFAAIQYNHFSF